MTARTTRRGRYTRAVIAVTAAIAIAITVVAFARPGRPAGRAFPPLHPAAAPVGWPHLALPNGTAVLSYPPSLHPLAGDTDAVSAARLRPGGDFPALPQCHPQARQRAPAGLGRVPAQAAAL